ncbi:MAG: phosphate signaling complex protein PhoU [Bacteroidota bacterium]
MERHIEQELENLKQVFLRMADLVENSFQQAVDALLSEDDRLAEQVINGDQLINAIEVEIDESIISILALQHPLASDLRLIVATLKVNNDLERIGDHAVNIAESVRTLRTIPGSEPLMEIPAMARTVKEMLTKALHSFIHLDADLAADVLASDDTIDELNRKNTHAMISLSKSDSHAIDGAMELVRISRNLERVADLTTNIAEEVIFVTQARDVRHPGNRDR